MTSHAAHPLRLELADPGDRALLADVVAGERELARLTARLDQADLARRYRSDLFRREIVSLERLAGRRIYSDQLAVVLHDPMTLSWELRDDLEETLALTRALDAISMAASSGGYTAAPDRSRSGQGGPVSISELVGEARATVEGIRAFLAAGPAPAETNGTEEMPDTPVVRKVDLLQPEGIEWTFETLGIRQSGLAAAAVSRSVSRCLAWPGLLGVACFLAMTDAIGSDETPIDPHDRARAAISARILASQELATARALPVVAGIMLGRVAGVPFPLFLSCMLTDAAAYRRQLSRARSGSERHAIVWILDRLAAGLRAEHARLDRLSAIDDEWIRRIGPIRENSSLPAALTHLHQCPAVSVASLGARLDLSSRGAQLVVGELVQAGILREFTGREIDRVFVAQALLD